MSRAQRSFRSEDGVKETTGVRGRATEGVHVHYTHVPQSLTRCEVGEDLQPHNMFTQLKWHIRCLQLHLFNDNDIGMHTLHVLTEIDA